MLSVSGALLLARRLGGWRNLLRPIRGNFSQRWHAEVGRLVLVGLMLSALSGTFLCATTFELIPDGSAIEPAFPPMSAPGRPCRWPTCRPCATSTSMTCANSSTPALATRRMCIPCVRPRATVMSIKATALCCPIKPMTRRVRSTN